MARTEEGYALVAAVAAMAVFALVAFQVLAGEQGDVAEVRAQAEHARLTAAADAGVALAIHGLCVEDTAERWAFDGSSRHLDFAGDALSVRIEDERSKVALAGLTQAQARALFAAAGASGDRLDALAGEFHRWTQTEDEAGERPSSDAQPGLAPRHGPFRTVGELAALRDMDPALYARIAPVVTTFFEASGGFEPRNASPLAAQVMRADDATAIGDPTTAPVILDQHPDEEIDADETLIGRTLTVRVTARAPDGASARRAAIVELTGDAAHPFWVRYTD